MPPENENAWKRLGQLLAARREEIAARYRNKNLFAAERGINRRMLWSVEAGTRGTYGKGTIEAIERAYALAPGSLERTLAGAPLEPLPSRPPEAELPFGLVNPYAGIGEPPAEPEGDEAGVLFPDDKLKRLAWRGAWYGATDEREARRRALEAVREIDSLRAGVRGEGRGRDAAGLRPPPPVTSLTRDVSET